MKGRAMQRRLIVRADGSRPKTAPLCGDNEDIIVDKVKRLLKRVK